MTSAGASSNFTSSELRKSGMRLLKRFTGAIIGFSIE
jgi:hypothetical protein